jgi:hypothetical protein
MKLLHCANCGDVFNLSAIQKQCGCGKCGGQFVDNHTIKIWGRCVPIGIDSITYTVAVFNRPERGFGKQFDAWVFPLNQNNIIKLDHKPDVE